MALTLDDVNRIAHLARIEVDPREADRILLDLTGIFGLIEEMQAVDTSGVEPMSHGQDVTLRLRGDAVTETDGWNLFEPLAPKAEANLYLVPQVIE